MSLRIIAGEHRRRKLRTNPGKTTRPITDRMKENLFHLLGGIEENATVADIFAGTGTLGIECLSRGADFAVFFENDRKAYELLRENVEHIGVGSQSLCWKVDVKRTSFTPKGVPDALPYSLIFFDPPYKLATNLGAGTQLGKALDRLSRDGISKADAVMVLRTPNEHPLELTDSWVETERVRIASSRISICAKSSVAEPKADEVD